MDALLCAGSDGDDDLSELAVALEVAVSLANVVEGKDAIDAGLQGSAFKTADDVINRCFPTSVVAARAPDVLGLGDSQLGDHVQHRRRRGFVAQGAIDEADALELEQLHELFEVRATDRIEHDAYAVTAGDAQ